jgi:hypothetical protein
MCRHHFVKHVKHAALGSNPGQIFPILALAIAALLGLAALGVDVFDIYWNKNRLQSGVDAAALAGAFYTGDVAFSGNNAQCGYNNDAQNAACTYALTNGIALGEIQSIVVNSTSLTATVTASRGIPALFAKVLGFTQFTVSANATAVLEGLSSAADILPVGLDSTTTYSYGQTIALHNDGCGPGCWQGIALQSATNGNNGGNAYQQNLAQGCSCTVNVGDSVTTEPGAKTGPTSSGVSQRVSAGLSADPSGTWNSHSASDGRAAIAAIVNWNGCNGRCTVPVMGFAEVWISGTTGSDINAVFIRQVSSDTGSASAPNFGALHATLTQ